MPNGMTSDLSQISTKNQFISTSLNKNKRALPRAILAPARQSLNPRERSAFPLRRTHQLEKAGRRCQQGAMAGRGPKPPTKDPPKHVVDGYWEQRRKGDTPYSDHWRDKNRAQGGVMGSDSDSEESEGDIYAPPDIPLDTEESFARDLETAFNQRNVIWAEQIVSEGLRKGFRGAFTEARHGKIGSWMATEKNKDLVMRESQLSREEVDSRSQQELKDEAMRVLKNNKKRQENFDRGRTSGENVYQASWSSTTAVTEVTEQPPRDARRELKVKHRETVTKSGRRPVEYHRPVEHHARAQKAYGRFAPSSKEETEGDPTASSSNAPASSGDTPENLRRKYEDMMSKWHPNRRAVHRRVTLKSNDQGATSGSDTSEDEDGTEPGALAFCPWCRGPCQTLAVCEGCKVPSHTATGLCETCNPCIWCGDVDAHRHDGKPCEEAEPCSRCNRMVHVVRSREDHAMKCAACWRNTEPALFEKMYGAALEEAVHNVRLERSMTAQMQTPMRRWEPGDDWEASVEGFGHWWSAKTYEEQGWDDGDRYEPISGTCRTKSSAPNPQNLCYEYVRNGTCSYGEQCAFLHQKEKYDDGQTVEYYPEHPEERYPCNPNNRNIVPGAAVSMHQKAYEVTCHDCQKSFLGPHMSAYLMKPDFKEFYNCDSNVPVADLAMRREALSDSQVATRFSKRNQAREPFCVFCAGARMHDGDHLAFVKRKYVQSVADGTEGIGWFKQCFTKPWRKGVTKSKSQRTTTARGEVMNRIMEANEEKAQRLEKRMARPDYKPTKLDRETLDAYRRVPLVRCMTDWIASVSETLGVTLHYGCKCGRTTLLKYQPHLADKIKRMKNPGAYSLWPRGMWLTVPWDCEELQTTDLENSPQSDWGCAACALKWVASQMYKLRLTVVNNAAFTDRLAGLEDRNQPGSSLNQGLTLESADNLPQALMFYVGADLVKGRLNAELDSWITTLRMAVLVKEIKDWHPDMGPQQLTKELIDAVICTANDRTLAPLMTNGDCVMIKACPANGHDRPYGRKAMCLDWNRSVQEVGEIVPALLVDHADLEPCPESQLRDLLLNCGALVDLDDLQAKVYEKFPGKNGMTRKHTRRLCEEATAKRPELFDRLRLSGKL